MKKRILSIVLIVALVATLTIGLAIGLTACNPTEEEYVNPDYSNIKVGFIMLHDPANSTYDKNFYNAMEEVRRGLGLSESQVLYRHTIPEGPECTQAADDLVEEGCNIIFADSFGHETYLLESAKKHPNVQFLHATGTQAHTANQKNFHNAFASIYEGRYLAGVAAGLKLKEMGYGEGKDLGDAPLVGYVGAFPYAEVKSGYTSWFLGVRSIFPKATMKVTFTNSWFDIDLEKGAAEKLIAEKCVLISQHADSLGAPQACEAAGVPNVSYNGSTEATGPNTFIISSRIDWAPYLKYAINCVHTGSQIATDWTGTIATGSVQLTAIGDKVFKDKAAVQKQLDEVRDQFVAGTLHVFDTSKFQAYKKDDKGVIIPDQYYDFTKADHDGYKADVDTDAAFTPDTDVISDGYFHESEYRSAPYFDLDIVGITDLGNYSK